MLAYEKWTSERIAPTNNGIYFNFGDGDRVTEGTIQLKIHVPAKTT